MNSFQQPSGHLRPGKRQSRMPQVFQQQPGTFCCRRQCLVDQFTGRIDDFLIRMCIFPGQTFHAGNIRNVVYRILCLMKQRTVPILQKCVHQCLAVCSAKIFVYLFFGSIFPDTPFHISVPEIKPVIRTAHMYANHLFFRNNRTDIIPVIHQFHTIKALQRCCKIFHRRITLQIPFHTCYIKLCFHPLPILPYLRDALAFFISVEKTPTFVSGE